MTTVGPRDKGLAGRGTGQCTTMSDSDPDTAPDRSEDEEHTSDSGGDSDPATHEGFEPPNDEGRDLVTPA